MKRKPRVRLTPTRKKIGQGDTIGPWIGKKDLLMEVPIHRITVDASIFEYVDSLVEASDHNEVLRILLRIPPPESKVGEGT